ncbi:MAG: sortase [Patescibacteria group bacterium]
MPHKKTNHQPARVDQAALIKLYRQALTEGVPLEKVDQKVNKIVSRMSLTEDVEMASDEEKLQQLKAKKIPRSVRIVAALTPLIFLGVGLVLVGSAVMPILGYYLKTLPDMRSNQLATPIPQEQVLDVMPLMVAQASTTDILTSQEDEYGKSSGPVIIDAKLDYTNLANWFDNQNPADLKDNPNAVIQDKTEEQLNEYILEIPKLEVYNAVVNIGGTNLNKSLIHYPGTAMPGKAGSPVIFGHSVLRQFYNPKETNPRRYNSIFSKIMTLEKGDKIYLRTGNVKYTYMVDEKTEVKPTDTYILSQRYDVRQLKLVTCVPEGTYLRRGVVTAQLIKE